jgi:hypothetical protein
MLPLVSLITITGYVIILAYLTQIKCKCALSWKRTYILSFIGIIILINLIALLLSKKKHMSISLMFVVITLTIFNAILMIQYTTEIRNSKCICGTSPIGDTFPQFTMLFIAFSQIFFILFIILSSLFFYKK